MKPPSGIPLKIKKKVQWWHPLNAHALTEIHLISARTQNPNKIQILFWQNTKSFFTPPASLPFSLEVRAETSHSLKRNKVCPGDIGGYFEQQIRPPCQQDVRASSEDFYRLCKITLGRRAEWNRAGWMCDHEGLYFKGHFAWNTEGKTEGADRAKNRPAGKDYGSSAVAARL